MQDYTRGMESGTWDSVKWHLCERKVALGERKAALGERKVALGERKVPLMEWRVAPDEYIVPHSLTLSSTHGSPNDDFFYFFL